MHTTTFVIGGCRSGKSGHALALGEAVSGPNRLFLATCVPQDQEMVRRVRRHQLEREERWKTVDAPVDLVGVLAALGPQSNVVLIDCLTLWVTNLLMAHDDDEPIIEHMTALQKALKSPPCPVILVSNEVGTGIVPENRLSRRFRDLAGWCNQKTAAACDQVVWMVAGIPVTIKSDG